MLVGGLAAAAVWFDARGKASGFATTERVGRSAGQPAKPSRAPTGKSSGKPSTQRSPAGQPGGPVRCTPNGTLYCFPKATVDSVSAVMKSKGGTCVEDDQDLACVTGTQAENTYVTLQPAGKDSGRLATLSAMTFSRAAGENAKGRQVVIDNLVESMPRLLKALLPGETKTQQAITAWLPKNLENCPDKPVRIGGYNVNCDPPTQFDVTDREGDPLSSWSVGITVGGQTAFPR